MPSRKRPVSALLARVTKSRSKGPESRSFTGPGINVPSRRPTAEFRDGPALELFFVRLLREGQPLLRDMVRITGLDRVFDIGADEAEALGLILR